MRRSADTLGWPWRAKKPAGATQEDHTTATLSRSSWIQPAARTSPGEPLVIPAATFNTFIATAKALVKRPVAVYAEKVYKEGNFAGLGIGT